MKAHKEILTDYETIDNIAHTFINSLNNEYEKDTILKAYNIAKDAHKKQFRKSGDLYITHPIEVAKEAHKLGLDSDSLCAAFLHDTIEDTHLSYDDIKKEFNEDIANIVEGLTKLEKSRIPMRTDIERNITELRRMLLSASKDVRILMIKLCDRLHNMRTLHVRSETAQKRISKETLYVYASIAQKVGIYSLKWELEDLAFKYLHPKDFEFIKKKLKLKRKKREEIAQRGVTEIREFLKQRGITVISILGRPKGMYSIYRKISKKKVLFEDIYDLYAIRVITEDVEECYHIHSLLHEYFRTYPQREKDYIKNPKENSYQSLHTVVFSNAISSPIEIQIRTLEMHKLAEYGIAAHWKYKNVRKDDLFDKKISWLRELLQWEQENKETYNLMQTLKYDLFENEIFVFTPKYDIIALPQGATVLDFAYHIHTEVGNHAIRGRINSENANLDKVLLNGDIVEIITNSNQKIGEKALSIAKTNKAKIAIRQALGLKLHNKKEMDASAIPFSEMITFIEGLGTYSKIRNPKCCSFNLKDEIIGVENTKKSEISIHGANCENAKLTLHRKFKLIWDPQLFSTTTLGILSSKNAGILIDILNILKKYNRTPLKMKNRIHKDGSVFTQIKISKTEKLKELISEIKTSNGVVSIREVEDTL